MSEKTGAVAQPVEPDLTFGFAFTAEAEVVHADGTTDQEEKDVD